MIKSNLINAKTAAKIALAKEDISEEKRQYLSGYLDGLDFATKSIETKERYEREHRERTAQHKRLVMIRISLVSSLLALALNLAMAVAKILS